MSEWTPAGAWARLAAARLLDVTVHGHSWEMWAKHYGLPDLQHALDALTVATQRAAQAERERDQARTWARRWKAIAKRQFTKQQAMSRNRLRLMLKLVRVEEDLRNTRTALHLIRRIDAEQSRDWDALIAERDTARARTLAEVYQAWRGVTPAFEALMAEGRAATAPERGAWKP